MKGCGKGWNPFQPPNRKSGAKGIFASSPTSMLIFAGNFAILYGRETDMTDDEILGHLKEIALDEEGLDISGASLGSTLEELGFDSLSTLQMVVAVEDEFGIELGDGVDGMPETLGGIVDLIRGAMGE